jgi:hypothetical protein
MGGLNNAGDYTNLIENSTLQVACSPSQWNVPLGLIFMSKDAPVPFNTDHFSLPVSNYSGNGNTNAFTFDLPTYINYSNGCTISVANASATTTASVFADIGYKVGASPGPASQAYWNTYATSFPIVAANTGVWDYPQISLLPSTTFTGGGQLESIRQFVGSGNNYSYLEASPVITTDSTAILSGGGEDFWGCGYYCGWGTLSPHTSKWGLLIGSVGLQSPAQTYDSMGYRFFTANARDNAFFSTSLAATTANGMSGVSPGIVSIQGLLTWFTANPTANQIGISPAPGTYGGTTAVTLTPYPSTAAICYTTDGTTPTATTAGTCSHGSTYSSAVSVTSTHTINALGTLSGYNNSPVSTAAYTINSFTAPTYNTNCNNTASGTPSTTVNCTLTATAGDFAFVVCRGGGNTTSGSTYAVTSSPATSFSLVSTQVGASNGGNQASYAFSSTGGSTTYTCTGNTAVTYQCIQVLVYHPGSVTSLATGVSNLVTSSTSTYTSGAINTTGETFAIACGNPEFGGTGGSSGTIGGLTATGRTLVSSAYSYCQDVVLPSSTSGITGVLTATVSGTWDGVIAAFH